MSSPDWVEAVVQLLEEFLSIDLVNRSHFRLMS
jgi:hypothetical protein